MLHCTEFNTWLLMYFSLLFGSGYNVCSGSVRGEFKLENLTTTAFTTGYFKLNYEIITQIARAWLLIHFKSFLIAEEDYL